MVLQGARIERAFHALGDPTRRAILRTLGSGPTSVGRLSAPLGISVTAVSQHLHVLEAGGFVVTKKVGRVRTCTLDARGFSFVENWAREHRSLWERRLERLGNLLDE